MPQRFYCESPSKPRTDWRYAAFRTRLGWLAVVWHSQALAGLCFVQGNALAAARWANEFLAKRSVAGEAARESEVPWQLAAKLRQFAAGKKVSFAEVPLDITHLPPFARQVVAACCALGWGQTASYAEIAAQAGSPRAARAVGNCMKSNGLPLVIPCHRVVGARGSLGGYSGPSGVTLKRRLLEAEGAGVTSLVGEQP